MNILTKKHFLFVKLLCNLIPQRKERLSGDCSTRAMQMFGFKMN